MDEERTVGRALERQVAAGDAGVEAQCVDVAGRAVIVDSVATVACGDLVDVRSGTARQLIVAGTAAQAVRAAAADDPVVP